MASFCVTVPSRPGEEGARLGKEKRKECARMNEPHAPCGKHGRRGYFYLRRVFLFSSEGTFIQRDLRPRYAGSADRSGHRRGGGEVLQTESSARQRQQNSRRSKSSRYNCTAALPAISMFVNTGLANKLQPCMWRLRSADRRAHAEQPGSSCSVSLVTTAGRAGESGDLCSPPTLRRWSNDRPLSRTASPQMPDG